MWEKYIQISNKSKKEIEIYDRNEICRQGKTNKIK